MNLNLYSNIGKIFSGVSLNEHSQVNELRKKSSNSTCTSKSKVSFIKSHANFPYDNTNSTLATIKHNAKSSFNSEKRKKEIIIERPSSNIRKGEEKESYLRKESQNSSRGSVDKEQGKILRSFTNSSLLNNITINTNLNHSDSHSISNMNVKIICL